MEPRWNEVNKSTAAGLEAALAIEFNKLVLQKVALVAARDQEFVQLPGEGAAEFANRKTKFLAQLDTIPADMKYQEKRIEVLAGIYKDFMAGKELINTYTGVPDLEVVPKD